MDSGPTCRPVLVVVLLLFLTYHCGADSCGQGFDIARLEELVSGRCQDYQTKINPTAFCDTGLLNCTDVWAKFSSGFQHRPQCNFSAGAFDPFIHAANTNIAGKMLFWSGTYDLVHKYSDKGHRYTTLEDTLTGYMIDGPSFCGEPPVPGSSTRVCPRRDAVTCPAPAWNAFWTAASINFAHHATGEVHVLMNATRSPIFKVPSYFAEVEVPNINSSRVTKITILLINDSPSRVRSPCTEDDSLQLLKQQLRPIDVHCVENPRDLVYQYCVDNPSAEVCDTSAGINGVERHRPCGLSVLVFILIYAYVSFV